MGLIPRGPNFDAVIIGVIVFVSLLMTAHIWGPLSGRIIRRCHRNASIAGEHIFRFLMKRIVGQGSTRPSHDEKKRYEGK